MKSFFDIEASQKDITLKLFELLKDSYQKETYSHFINSILYGGIERWFE